MRKISDDHRPQLLEIHPTWCAGGEAQSSYDRAIMDIKMGPLSFDHMCVVAAIVNEVLLGEELLLM